MVIARLLLFNFRQKLCNHKKSLVCPQMTLEKATVVMKTQLIRSCINYSFLFCNQDELFRAVISSPSTKDTTTAGSCSRMTTDAKCLPQLVIKMQKSASGLIILINKLKEKANMKN